jgi:glucosamine--fructose-6-phosphate aminotransferase (isomerizing)
VVHNGIIENYQELRAELTAAGAQFSTETDTETVAVLVQHLMSEGHAPKDAVTKALTRLDGAFALAFLFEGEEDLLIAARQGSPLAIGHGDGEMFVGSDAIALAPMTDRITYLEEGDMAVLTRSSVDIWDARGQRANRDMDVIQMDAAQVDKAGYKHFMAKEIAEQPTVVGNAIAAYLSEDRKTIDLPGGDFDFSAVTRLTLVGCGTAYLSCLTAKYWFEKLAGLPVDVDIASEFRYREPPFTPGTVSIFVSQSGETADTLAALRHAKGKADKILSLVNVPTSTIARESDLALPILAGVEISVASTKALTCQLSVFLALALKAGLDRGLLEAAELAKYLAAFQSVPALLNQSLNIEAAVQQIASKIATASDILFLGRGMMYPMALEGALKLKELSYIHAEGYPSGELKHGPIALVEETVPIVVLAPRDALFEKSVSNMQEVMARKGKVLLISDRAGLKAAGEGVWDSIAMPEVDPLVAPIVYAVPAQLLAYHTVVAKGTDVDQPRNLAKSVTVE